MAYEFEDSEELALLRQTVRQFAEKEIAPLAHQLDEKEEFSVPLTRAMGELGLFGAVVAPEYGGQGMDYLSYIVAAWDPSTLANSSTATM